MENILIIGAGGQIGTVLCQALQERYGESRVIASDLRVPPNPRGIFVSLDATQVLAIADIVRQYNVTQIYHLAAVLSASGEANPIRTWELNMQTLLNVLEVARTFRISKVFVPSSIAVFGEDAPHVNTPQQAFLDPATVYGISKVAAENWLHYYHTRYGLDIRSLRYPGVVSYQSLPGGGTTDYAVDIFHKAVHGQPFTCFLKEDTRLPMIYMDDAIRATLELMEADAARITVRTSYNLAGLSFTPAELTAAIQVYYPSFQTTYQPDFRQQIAESWPQSIDDTRAAADWDWKPAFDLARMTGEMIHHLSDHSVLA
ncbi:NAD-dependent epimerase/dehydratase family protein [Siphonobacter aquaeclarae]|uniref:Nucleoside-diphosphate-sugar epimerase n=1 Tax=Siphonobacter aquaeclarae TaxID=563176 RepID=A0A1G9R5M7_9BACT|nr:NAD-dependent epimerase/dehydratase family protein [Siphonobacter aquaeclarae]SDM18137.1 Nucleoside-diphosphate-sugar epimerase [Siphonobacter aquaeclarae]